MHDARTVLASRPHARLEARSAQSLADLGEHDLRLTTNNPAKLGGLRKHGLRVVERVAMPTLATAENVEYLRTKRDRMGHLLELPDAPDPLPPDQSKELP